MEKHLGLAAMVFAFVLVMCGGSATAARKHVVADAVMGQQSGACTGVVKDSKGETLPGASVVVKNADGTLSTNGTTTNIDGEFTIGNVPTGATIVVSFIGYKTAEMKWNGQPLNVTLADDTEQLEEVVVVGFGTQKKVNLTGAVSTVSSKELTARPVSSVTDALQGVVPGMNFAVGSEGGRLNASKGFNIRGKGTIGEGSSVSPLVLIDGMEGSLTNLNPADVENISVLKDASASSIYGSRAAGGVILVTTKKGSKGKVSVNYSDNFRFNSPLNMPKMMDSYTWALYANAASINAGEGVWFSENKLNQIKACQNDPSLPTMYKNNNNRWEIFDDNNLLPTGNTDWLKEHFGNSFSQEHNLSISGGSETIDYYFSANYLTQEGILKHGDENRDRYNVTAKIGAQIYPWLYFSYNTRFTRVNYESPSWIDNTVFYHNIMRSWPIIPAYDPNGNPVVDGNTGFISELEDGGTREDVSDQLAQQLAIRLTPIKGLVLNGELNYRIDNNLQHKDYFTTYLHDCDNNPQPMNNTTTRVYEYAYKQNYFNPNVYAEYSRSVAEKHNFKAMIGFQSEWAKYRNVSGQKDGIISGLPTLNTASGNPKTSGKYQNWSTAGVFGRLNYDYEGKYLFEANIRYDGSSRFLKNKRWNWFPSFSAGWNIAREKFWEGLTPYVNTLKLRGSYGRLGNQNTDNWYPFYSKIGFKSGAGEWLVDGKQPNIASQPALVSALLTWEKSRTWELGLDFGALDNRLTGTVSYFQRKTYDMVGPAPELPSVLGTTVPKVNNLDMTSKGWELQLSWRDQIKDFTYGVTLMLSDNTVTIDKYPNESKDLSKYYDGAKLGDIWGYQTVGIAKTQAEMDAHIAKVDQSALGSGWGAGDIMYADLDGNGKISTNSNTLADHGDRKIIGNSTPRYNFGLNLEASWKGFDLKAFFQGVLKRDYMPDDAVFWGACGIGKWQMNGLKPHMDYFRDDPNDPLGQNLNSYYPKPNWKGWRNNKTQTRYLQNAAYCRLKNLTLGYTLPQRWTNVIGCEKLRVFVSAENLWTITNFTDLADPEMIDAGGWNFGKMYPLSKTWSVGLNLNF